jgi:hypothetical protein
VSREWLLGKFYRPNYFLGTSPDFTVGPPMGTIIQSAEYGRLNSIWEILARTSAKLILSDYNVPTTKLLKVKIFLR